MGHDTMPGKDPNSAEFKEMEVASESDTPTQQQGDYSGAIAKTDADEIALCKKLDRRVLPVLWAMYYL
jgi:hypothetical protein